MISATTNYNKTNFGMAVKFTPNAIKLLHQDLSLKDAKKIDKIVKAQKNNPTDIKVLTTDFGTIETKKGQFKYVGDIQASAGNATFHSGKDILDVFRSDSANIVKMLKKAAKHADELTVKKNFLKNIDIQA